MISVFVGGSFVHLFKFQPAVVAIEQKINV